MSTLLNLKLKTKYTVCLYNISQINLFKYYKTL